MTVPPAIPYPPSPMAALPPAAPAVTAPVAQPVLSPVPVVQPGTPPDTFAQAQVRPTPPEDTALYRIKHPRLFGLVSSAAQQASAAEATNGVAPTETANQRTAMFFALYDKLDETGKTYLKTLLPTGKLFRAQAEDRHSTIYHMYAMATTPRLPGIDGPRAVQDLLRLMIEPQTIVQTFVSLAPQDAQEMLRQFNLHPVDLPKGKTSISSLDYLQAYSADCVPAAIMARQAMDNYDELARQLNEMTGLGYFNETVRAEEIWPKNPAEAEAVMNEWHWTYQPTPGQPGTYTVRFETPDSVKMRMAYAHRRNSPRNEQTPIEGGYQGTLAYQGAGKQYNGILGKRWDPTNQLSIGLNAIEKTVLENAIEDGKSIHSVQYQVATGKKAPAGAPQDGDSYLFGYTVPFTEVQKHLLLALDLGWEPVVGFVETDAQGRIDMAHEILIKGKRMVGNQLYFEVIDTDDDNPQTVLRSAKEIIPKLHHVSYPFGLAQKIEADINSRFQQFFIPSPEDQAQYNLISVSRQAPMDGWEEMIWPEKVEALRKQAQQPQAQPVFPNQAPPVPPAVAQQPSTPLSSPTLTPETIPPGTIGVPTRPAASVPATPLSPAPATTLYPPYQPTVTVPQFTAPQASQPSPFVAAAMPYPAYAAVGRQ